MGSHAARVGITRNKFEDFTDMTPCHFVDIFFCHLFNNADTISDYIMTPAELLENYAFEWTSTRLWLDLDQNRELPEHVLEPYR
jgi:hypothetical protein